MILTKLIEEMMGDGQAEFERVTLLLPVETLAEALDLAAQIGVPRNRLLAELVLSGLPEARTEWRALSMIEDDPVERAETPAFSLQVPRRVK